MSGPKTTCQTCHSEVAMGNDRHFYHANGSVACEVDGIQHIERVADPNEYHYDFCGSVGVDWTLVCGSRINAEILVYDEHTLNTVASQTHGMSEDWAACDDCHELIVKGDWSAVADKALALIGSDNFDVNAELLQAVKELHEQVRLTMVEWVSNPGGKNPGR